MKNTKTASKQLVADRSLLRTNYKKYLKILRQLKDLKRN